MRQSIAGRLALLLAGFALIAGTLASIEVYRMSREHLVEAAQARLVTTTEVLSRRMHGVLEAALRDVRRMAVYADVQSLLRDAQAGKSTLSGMEHVAGVLKAELMTSPEYYQVRVISAAENGLERVRLERESDGSVVQVTGDDLQEKGHMEYVRETLLLPPGGLFASRMRLNRETGTHAGTDVPTLRVAAPVYVEGQLRPVGLVVASLSLKGIFDAVDAEMPKDLELYVADEKSEFVVHPDPARAFAFDRGQSSPIPTQFPATQALFSGMAKTVVETVSMREGSHERDVIAAFARQDFAGFPHDRFLVVGLAKPVDLVLASTRTLALHAAIVVVMLGVLAFVVAAWAAPRLTRPLRTMAETVSAYPAQPLAPSLPVDRPDEIGVLARGLRAMEAAITRQMNEIEAQRGELLHRAQHDSLTNLPNRSLFIDRLEQALARSRRSSQAVALLFIDLDRFKPINDQHGHAAGDFVLQSVAERLRRTVRAADTVARIGGDEFVIIMEGTDDAHYLETISLKVVAAIRETVSWQGKLLQVGASVGIACFPRDGDSVDSLTSFADSGMYRAKSRGGSGVARADRSEPG